MQETNWDWILQHLKENFPELGLFKGPILVDPKFLVLNRTAFFEKNRSDCVDGAENLFVSWLSSNIQKTVL